MSIRTLVSKSGDALQNPSLIYENVARLARYLTSINFKGGIAIASDCTKVRKRLSMSTQFGFHILGTTLPLSDVEVEDSKDLDDIVDQATQKNALATQVRAIIAKVGLRLLDFHPLISNLLNRFLCRVAHLLSLRCCPPVGMRVQRIFMVTR